MSVNAILYTRPGCHLCDIAADQLSRYGIPFQRVNIDQDEDLKARYDQCVPVVVIDGKERFRGKIDGVLLRRLLAGHRP
jgi:glutaredoxin